MHSIILAQRQDVMEFSISESMNLLHQTNIREDNTLKIRQAAPSEFIWVTSQIYQDKRLNKFVWEKMFEIMEMKNDIRTAELSTYIYNYESVMYRRNVIRDESCS